MWVDYLIYVTTGLVVVSAVGLIVVVLRNRPMPVTQIVLVVLLVAGIAVTPLVGPERFREPGHPLTVVDVDGAPTTDVELIGTCLSVYRKIGPLSFIMGTALLPAEGWDRGPYSGCDASAFSGVINLPRSVRPGSWMLCDYATCHVLVAG